MLARHGLLLVCMLILSCSTLTKKPVQRLQYNSDFSIRWPEKISLLLPPLHQQQKIEVLRQGHEPQTFITVLKTQNNILDIVGLSPLGMTLFTLKVGQQKIETNTSQWLPKEFKADYVLVDLLLAHARPGSLNAYIDGDAQVKEVGLALREIWVRGELVATVTFTPDHSKPIDIKFVHHMRKYQLNISVLRGNP